MKAKYEKPTMEVINMETTALLSASSLEYSDRLEKGFDKWDDDYELDGGITSGNW